MMTRWQRIIDDCLTVNTNDCPFWGYQLRVPHLVIRSLSDRADDNARRDMLLFYETAARNSAKLVLAIVEGL